ncbi:MAG: beta-L-arabinofuranosidase domain-containing protein [Thermoguttaceae bacterium]
MNTRTYLPAALAVIVSLSVRQASTAEPIRALPDKIPCAAPDKQDFQIPDRIHLTGWVGTRLAGNEDQCLKFKPEGLLAAYHRSGPLAFYADGIGELSGKWIHAGTLVWARTGDPALRKKLDTFVAELCKCQRDDGYLGGEVKPWTSPWGVWSIKYNLIGLLTYIQYTGNRDPLPTCLRMADSLCKTFGDETGKRSITSVGYCGGMSSVSVLEPMVLLYRFTGEPRYLDFCKHEQRAWVDPNIASLLKNKRIEDGTKAYEYLACLNGALEYYRTVGGDRHILDACLIAWQDIVDKKLYVTGGSSYFELFHGDFFLPNGGPAAETCVTVTWLQFNAQLLRLTGEARFAEQLERTVLNHLLGAQRPDCVAWDYFTPLDGQKPYDRPQITPPTMAAHGLFWDCCRASGPRGVALIPTWAITTDAEGPVVNLYDAGTAQLALRDGTAVSLAVETLYPGDGRIQIAVNPAAKKAFAVKLRIPAWCRSATAHVNGEPVKVTPGYTAIQRAWSPGDKIEVELPLETKVVIGDHTNVGYLAFQYGPFVLAAEGTPATRLAGAIVPSRDAVVFREPGPKTALEFHVKVADRELRLVPFADAGGSGCEYKVWLPVASGSLLRGGTESRSRPGIVTGSIIDDDPDTFVNTRDISYKTSAKEDWFAVTLDKPVAIRRVVFRHGRCDGQAGGWFTGSKPKVQVQREKDAAWETIGELSDYPVTNWRSLIPGQPFTLRLAEPVKVLAVRVIGTPGERRRPERGYSSCAELQAFGE